MSRLGSIFILLIFSVFTNQADAQIALSKNGQRITAPFWLKIESLPGWTIHYTIDGSEPSANSTLWTDSLFISSELNQSRLSEIPTTEQWAPPASMPSNDVIFRWIAFHPQFSLTPKGTENYLFYRDHEWPILSISGPMDHFFASDSGIYVVGNNEVANYFRKGKRWEREMHAELRSKDNEVLFSQQLGFRIHGRSSRTNPQKSLRLYAREEYGTDKIDYPLFGAAAPQDFEHLILRAPEKMFSSSLIIDEVIQRLALDLDINPQHSIPVETRLNGEYWGVAFLRERQDDVYIKDYFGYDKDEIDLIEWDRQPELENGTLDHYNEWISWLKQGEKNSSEDIAHLDQYISVEHFLDYFCYQSIIANEDWPKNNLRFWRPNDGTWRFMFYDADASMQRHNIDPIVWVLEKTHDGNPVSLIIEAFQHNEEFMHRLYLRMNQLLCTTLSVENWSSVFDQVKAEMAPQVMAQSDRWYNPSTLAEWNFAVNEARSFISYRNTYLSNWLSNRVDYQLFIYPNPCGAQSHVRFETDFGNIPISVGIFNIQGQEVAVNAVPESPTLLIIDTSSLPNGLYILRAQLGAIVQHSRILVNQ